ncbi:hypothetical protein [Pendulispora albinea]|uniref:Uncharacterized protein n=1 Tax=Pendulispora albinea TaxID=2741071 RepID=A0ABZ2LL60_9BACT
MVAQRVYPVELLRRFLAYHDPRGGGGALIVSSIGGTFPSPMPSLDSSSLR